MAADKEAISTFSHAILCVTCHYSICGLVDYRAYILICAMNLVTVLVSLFIRHRSNATGDWFGEGPFVLQPDTDALLTLHVSQEEY